MSPANGNGHGATHFLAASSEAAAKVTLLQDHTEGTTCGSCGFLHVPARTYRCQNCGGRDLQATRVPLRGTIVTFTVLKAAEGEKPPGLALVRLDAGPVVMCSLSLDGPPPAVGARVLGHVEPIADDPVSKRLRVSLVHAPLAATNASTGATQRIV